MPPTTALLLMKALGWALLSSFWHFAMCWLLYFIIVNTFRKLPSCQKHAIGISLMAAGSILFIVQFGWYVAGGFPVTIAMPRVAQISLENLIPAGVRKVGVLQSILPYASLLYLGVVGILFIRLSLVMQKAGQLQVSGISKLPPGWKIYIRQVSAQLGITKKISAYLSIHIDTPQVIGVLKPVILLPAACLANLTTTQLEAVLLHELAHIRRHDYLINMFVAATEIIFFFNPFVKQLAIQIRKEREYSCDDMVLQFQYQPANYAAALLSLEKGRIAPVRYGIAAAGKNKKQLLKRIERLVGIQPVVPARKRALVAAAGGILLLTALVGVSPGGVTVDSFSPARLVFDNSAEKTALVVAEKKIALVDLNGGSKSVAPAMIKHPKSVSAVSTALSGSNKPAATKLTQMTWKTSQDESRLDEAIAAADRQTIDFSLREPQDGMVPDEVAPTSPTAEPYVPARSFSFQLTQDTSFPIQKGETYEEQSARELMLKTTKALAAMDWLKIEKQLKYNKASASKLKAALMNQLKLLNWQQLNATAQQEQRQRQEVPLARAIEQDEAIRRYKEGQVIYEVMRQKLAAQQESIKINAEQFQQSRKATEDQRKQLLQEMKKRRIIYI